MVEHIGETLFLYATFSDITPLNTRTLCLKTEVKDTSCLSEQTLAVQSLLCICVLIMSRYLSSTQSTPPSQGQTFFGPPGLLSMCLFL